MRVRRWASAIGLSIALVAFAGCDNSADPPERFERNLSDSGGGLPTLSTVADVGILNDQTQYKAADTLRGPVDAGDTTGQVRAFIEDLVTALGSGEVESVLDMFNPDHIELLRDSIEASDKFFETFGDTRAALEASVSTELGPEVVEQYKERARRAFFQILTIEVHGANSATVTPNLPLQRFLGPLAPANIAVEKSNGQWLIQLESPMSEADVDAVIGFQQRVLDAMEELINMVDDGRIENADQIQAARTMAVLGETPTIETEPDEPDGGDPEP